MADFFSLTLRRHSCRRFEPVPVEKHKLLNCVKAARTAPSSCNSQPWSFVVVNRRALLRRAAGCIRFLGMNQHVVGDSAFIVVVEEPARAATRIGGLLLRKHFSQMDLGIAVAHILYAAESQGLSTCVLGCFHEAWLREVLGIPPCKRLRLVVAVGYRKGGTGVRTGRKPLEEILTYLG